MTNHWQQSTIYRQLVSTARPMLILFVWCAITIKHQKNKIHNKKTESNA
jgi:hypothetical protein